MAWRPCITCVVFFFSTIMHSALFGQIKWKPVYTTHWDHLLSSPTENLSVIGVLATEASIMVLDSNQTHYKVMVSNGDIGYIQKQNLTARMRGKTSRGEPAQYFYRGAQGQQGPHLYVQAAELRVRSMPSVNGKVIRRARINEHTSLDYMPLYTEGWIYVGDHFHESPAYIQAKFLGPPLSYEQVLDDYLQVKGRNPLQELTLAGRLRELAWQQPKKYLKQALAFYAESYRGTHVKLPLTVDLAFENLIADHVQRYVTDYNQYAKQMTDLDLRYVWDGKLLYDQRMTDKQMVDLGFEKRKDIPDSPECGWYPFYFYTSPTAVIAFEEDGNGKLFGSVYSFAFSDDKALILGKTTINNNFSEANFVRQFGQLLSVDWISFPHVYTIKNGDAGFYTITFTDGKPTLFQSHYYC